MNINWKVRFKNPIWWAQVAVAIVMPLVIGMGYQWSDMTTWSKLFDTLWQAVQNPCVLFAMLASLWTAITDPTTAGICDSKQALEYDAPKAD